VSDCNDNSYTMILDPHQVSDRLFGSRSLATKLFVSYNRYEVCTEMNKEPLNVSPFYILMSRERRSSSRSMYTHLPNSASHNEILTVGWAELTGQQSSGLRIRPYFLSLSCSGHDGTCQSVVLCRPVSLDPGFERELLAASTSAVGIHTAGLTMTMKGATALFTKQAAAE